MVNMSRAIVPAGLSSLPPSLPPSLPSFLPASLSLSLVPFSITHANSCLEGGLLPALTYRNMARLHATATLLTLSLPVSQDGEKWLLETLQGQQRAGVHMDPQRLQLCTHLASSPGPLQCSSLAV